VLLEFGGETLAVGTVVAGFVDDTGLVRYEAASSSVIYSYKVG